MNSRMSAVRIGERPRTFQADHPNHVTEGDAMAELDRTVWTAPVRNFDWVLAHFGHR